MKCKTCKGKGVIWTNDFSDEMGCPDCDGTGVPIK